MTWPMDFTERTLQPEKNRRLWLAVIQNIHHIWKIVLNSSLPLTSVQHYQTYVNGRDFDEITFRNNEISK